MHNLYKIHLKQTSQILLLCFTDEIKRYLRLIKGCLTYSELSNNDSDLYFYEFSTFQRRFTHFLNIILLLFKYSCLHLPPTTPQPPQPSPPFSPDSTPLSFFYMSFIVVPENHSHLSHQNPLPPSPWLLSDCS